MLLQSAVYVDLLSVHFAGEKYIKAMRNSLTYSWGITQVTTSRAAKIKTTRGCSSSNGHLRLISQVSQS